MGFNLHNTKTTDVLKTDMNCVNSAFGNSETNELTIPFIFSFSFYTYPIDHKYTLITVAVKVYIRL